MKSPAFQFYPNDFLGGVVATYSLEEIGLYMSLLAFDWNLNGLPLDAEKLAKMARVSARKFRSLWATVGDNFVERDGRYHNPRLDLERAKQEENRTKKKQAADSRWNADAHAGALHVECSPSSTPSSSPVTAKQTPPPRAAVVRVPDDDPRFAAVWAIYPPRVGGNPRKEAFAAWKARLRAGVPPEVIQAGVERYRAFLEAKGSIGTEYVLQAKTFFGPSDRYLEPWTPPVVAVRAGAPAVGSGDAAAWDDAMNAVANLSRGSWDSATYLALPANLRAALKAIGGWTAIRDARATDLPFRRRDFLAAYHAAEPAGAA